MEKREYNSIDLIKILMAVIIASGHIFSFDNVKNELAYSVYRSFFNMGVPFFFIVSGFLLANKFDDKLENQKNCDYVKRTLFKTIKMYLGWTIAYLPITIYHFIVTGDSFFRCLVQFVKGLFLIGEQYNSWHLWYLLSAIYALILVLILIKMRFNRKKFTIAWIVMVGLTVGISYLISIKKENLCFEPLCLLQDLIKRSIGSERILRGAVYIPAGILLQRKKIPVWLASAAFCIGFTLDVFIESLTISAIFNGIAVIAFFEILLAIKLPDSVVYPFLRKMSTVVYFTHMYVWTIYYMVVYGKKTFGTEPFLITMGIDLFIAFLYVYLKNRKQRQKQDAKL